MTTIPPVPHTFSNGTLMESAQINENFDHVKDQVNLLVRAEVSPIIGALPFPETISETVVDANKIMNNFEFLRSQINNNADITVDPAITAFPHTIKNDTPTDAIQVNENFDHLLTDISANTVPNATSGTDWAQTGNGLDLSGGGGIAAMAIATMDTSTIAFIDNTGTELRTYSWDGTDWTQIGNALNIGGTSFAAIAAMTSTRIAFIDAFNDELRVYDWDGSDWSQVGNDFSKSIVGSPRLAAMRGNRVALSNSNLNEVEVYDFDGTDWAKVGNTLAVTSPQALTALNYGTTPGVTDLQVYNPFTGNNRIAVTRSFPAEMQVYDFDGVNWTQVGTGLSTAGAGNIAISSLYTNIISYIDSTNDQLRTYTFDDTNFTQMGNSLAIPTVGQPALAVINSQEVAFVDDTNDELRTYTFS